MALKNKSTCLNNLSIADAENFESPQKSSTPFKVNKNNPQNILKDNHNLNISVINKQDQLIQKTDVDIYNQQKLSENYNGLPELFHNDSDEDSTETENKTASVLNDSHNWMTLSDISVDKNGSNISNLFSEIDVDIQVKFEKPPRQSYPGKKRNNKSMFENEEENENSEVKIIKKYKKPKLKKNINTHEDILIQSINEHFSDVESFNLSVE